MQSNVYYMIIIIILLQAGGGGGGGGGLSPLAPCFTSIMGHIANRGYYYCIQQLSMSSYIRLPFIRACVLEQSIEHAETTLYSILLSMRIYGILFEHMAKSINCPKSR